MAKSTTSVGLRGARIIGDAKVSSLMQFSWSARHDSTATGQSSDREGNRSALHGQSAVFKRGQQAKDRSPK
jgi:hypothetical protein